MSGLENINFPFSGFRPPPCERPDYEEAKMLHEGIKMDRYSEMRPCPKCGGHASTHHYYGDFLQRYCTRCGYEWREKSLDSYDEYLPIKE